MSKLNKGYTDYASMMLRAKAYRAWIEKEIENRIIKYNEQKDNDNTSTVEEETERLRGQVDHCMPPMVLQSGQSQ